MEMPEPIAIKRRLVFDLDPAAIGSALRLLPAIACRVGHRNVKSTAAGTRATPTPETEFVRDCLTMTGPELVAKWYGGAGNAGRYAAEAAQAVMESRPRAH